MTSLDTGSLVTAPVAPTLTRKSAGYVLKNYRYIVDDPSFFCMKTLARFELMREWATRAPKWPATAFPDVESPLIGSQQSMTGAVATLRTDGYYVGLRLAPSVVEELLGRTKSAFCYGDRDPKLKFQLDEREELERWLGRKFKVASYFDQHEEWPIYRQLKEDPWILSIARAYLGCEPVYLRGELAWSFPYRATAPERRATAQVLHCDINGFKTLKFFFYITDVGPNQGPHAYLKKGGGRRTMLHQLLGQRCASLPEELLLRTYGADKLVVVCGPAGHGFVGDPYYFHRGTTPTEGTRLLLQMEFGCRRYRTWYFDV